MTEGIRYENYQEGIFGVNKAPNHKIIRELDNLEEHACYKGRQGNTKKGNDTSLWP